MKHYLIRIIYGLNFNSIIILVYSFKKIVADKKSLFSQPFLSCFTLNWIISHKTYFAETKYTLKKKNLFQLKQKWIRFLKIFTLQLLVINQSLILLIFVLQFITKLDVKEEKTVTVAFFVNSLVDFLKGDERKGFFIAPCTGNKSLFQIMFNLSENGDDCFNFFSCFERKKMYIKRTKLF